MRRNLSAKLFWQVLVDMVGVSGEISIPVRRRDDQHTAVGKYTRELGDHRIATVNMFDHLEADDEFKLTIVVRKVMNVGNSELEVFDGRSSDGILRDINADDTTSASFSQDQTAIPGSTTRVQN